MIRRLAVSAAATSALVLTAAAPALANHEEGHGPQPDLEFVNNIRDCEHLLKELMALPEGEQPEDIISDLQDHPWNAGGDNTAEPPEEIVHPGGWFQASLSEDNVFLDVDVADGVRVLVVVKGASDQTGVPYSAYGFINEPGVDLEGLYAPVNSSGEHPTISHYSICKLGKDDTPDDEQTTSPPDDKETDEPEPEETKTPESVPTSVPAGMNGSDGAPMALTGIVTAAMVALVAGAALLRRRFGQQS